jgi:hypothetical protein
MKTLRLALALTSSAMLACAANKTPATSTGNCDRCKSQEVCVTGICIPRMPVPSTWATEISPSAEDAPNAVTELLTVSGMNPVLTCDSATAVTVKMTYAATKPQPKNAGIVITLAPLIPGRPDMTFQAQATPDETGALKATVSVPMTASKRGMATIGMMPFPNDRTSPPRTFTATLAPSLSFDVRANDDIPLRGRLIDAGDQPLDATFVARAYQDGAVVSDSVEVGKNVGSKDGIFILSIPVLASLAPIEVVLLPQTDGQPYFVSAPRLPSSNVYANLDVKLPTYISSPAQFSVDVRGERSDGPPVPGALVRALTTLEPTEPAGVGTTTFVRDAITDAQGRAVLPLLPGSAARLLTYQLAVVPPAAEKYATSCSTTRVSSGGGSQGSAANLQTPPLPPRLKFTGKLLDEGGAPVTGVVVTATPDPSPPAACSGARSPMSAASTLEDGSFTLYLDAGTYQIDYDPPGRSPIPRLTEMDVAIDADVTRDVRLPAARVSAGRVRAADGVTWLANATVRFFEPRCKEADCSGPDRKAPWLRGIGQTDEDGAFRIVVPQPTAN